MDTSTSDRQNQSTMESQNRRSHFFPAYHNERVCHRWLGIMGVESSPEWKWSNLHSSSQNRWKQVCAQSRWEPGVCCQERQLCSGRSEREPTESGALLVSAPLLWRPAAHTLSPHSGSFAALPRRLNFCLLHTFTAPQQHPHHILPPLHACSCTSLPAVAPCMHSL